MISRVILVAVVMAAMALGLYAYFGQHYGTAYGQTIAFTALVVMQWANAFNARSTYESVFSRLRVMSKPFYVGLGASILLQVLAIVGPLQGLLHVTPVSFEHLAITGALVSVILITVVEIHKWIGRRRHAVAE